MRTHRRHSARIAAAALTLWSTWALTPAVDAATKEIKCHRARLFAWANYQLCVQKVLGKSLPLIGARESSMFKCLRKYRATWPRLQRRYAGAPCAAPRFVDNENGTVSDNLTGLVWEQKTNDGTLHDAENLYTWSTGAPWKEDGTLFRVFLSSLNRAAFGGSQGWRLPNITELLTIVAVPCESSPCVEPVFGPTAPNFTHTSSSNAHYHPSAWSVFFFDGAVGAIPKNGAGLARAVRGGL